MRRGDIYYVDLDPVVGREQSGRRPVLVVSVDELNTLPLVVTVVPGSDGNRYPNDFPSFVRVPADDSGLPKETVFLCFQVRALDHRRFQGRPAGQVSPSWMNQIEDSLKYCLGL